MDKRLMKRSALCNALAVLLLAVNMYFKDSGWPHYIHIALVSLAVILAGATVYLLVKAQPRKNDGK